MKKIFIVFILIAGFVLSGCASTSEADKLSKLSGKEIEAYNSNPDNTDKIVCRNEISTGTRIPKRVCHKQSSIAQRSRQDQDELQKIQSHSIQRKIPES